MQQGSLCSTGVAPFQRYYGPSRHRLVFDRFPGASGYAVYLAPSISRRDEDGFSSCLVLFFTLNREDFSFVIHLDRQPRTSRRREAQTGSRARSGSRSERHFGRSRGERMARSYGEHDVDCQHCPDRVPAQRVERLAISDHSASFSGRVLAQDGVGQLAFRQLDGASAIKCCYAVFEC